jgi:hypothetical protein
MNNESRACPIMLLGDPKESYLFISIFIIYKYYMNPVHSDMYKSF